MGMGKTACAIGAIQMNRPPPGWRANRAWRSLRARDHLGEQIWHGTVLHMLGDSAFSTASCWVALP